jgi:hypothetical protein
MTWYQDLPGSNFGVRVIILNETFEWLAVLIRIPEISGFDFRHKSQLS